MKENHMNPFPRVTPHPYLWTRIEAGIAKRSQSSVHPAVQWTLSICAAAMLCWSLVQPARPKDTETNAYHTINVLYHE
jgi:hypothetical protein